MKKCIIIFFLFTEVIKANSQTQSKYGTIDYFANDIENVHKYRGVESQFNLLNNIFLAYYRWDKINILKIQEEFGEKKMLKLKDKYDRAERDVNQFLDSMNYFLNVYPDSTGKYEKCLEYLRTALYSMRDLNKALQRNVNKDFVDSTTMIPIDKKASIKIVVADAILWESSYHRYAGVVGTEKYIQILKNSYWRSWEEINLESVSK
jgi:hypothetical protein